MSDLTKPRTFTYKIYRLDPLSSDLPFLTGKYSAISLQALLTDPGSFGMAYETEAAFTVSDWTRRLTRPNVHIFICVAHSEASSPSLPISILHGAWVGMVTQIGPTPRSIYELPHSGAPEPLDDAYETHWHHTGTWIDPAHRGRGVAKQLIETAVAYATESNGVDGVRQARIRLFTGPDNMTSVGLYGSRGFSKVGFVTIPEAVAGNGNGEYGFLGRTEYTENDRNDRLGIILERVVAG